MGYRTCFSMRYAILVILLLGTVQGYAEIRLPSIFSDNMVLQRESIVTLWGWSDGKQKVVVMPSWNQLSYYAEVDEKGRWELILPTPEAGGPYDILLTDGDETLLRNVLIGEVWICSGQSNMEMWMMGYVGEAVEGAVDELIRTKTYEGIRLLTINRNVSEAPTKECISQGWQEVKPATLSRFSAVAFYFGKTLFGGLHVPIGLICAAKSSSTIQEWMPKEDIDRLKKEEKHKLVKWNYSSRLYNGMIYPLQGFSARGFIWYQGESNIRDYRSYDELMISLVGAWRREWNNPQMPFYFVQLAPYKYGRKDRGILPLMVESQYKAASRIPLSEIVVTSDVGSTLHIHPGKKKEIGERLAFLTLGKDYGIEGFPHPSPVFKQAIQEGNQLILSFYNVGFNKILPNITGYFFSDINSLKGFQIAGKNRIFYAAKAKITEDRLRIIVWNDSVQAPVAVRYNFMDIPCGNVTTIEGQPLAPFRTDNWESNMDEE